MKERELIMSENEKYISRTDEMGSINISQDVLAVIAAAAALEVEGVGSMSAGASNDVAELTNRKVLSKGVRLAMEEEQIAIDLALTIKFGYAVPEVAQAVQRRHRLRLSQPGAC